MKNKKILLVLVLLGGFTGNAQLAKGNWLVGGSGKFQASKATNVFNGTEQTSIVNGVFITPDIGYFAMDKFVIGLSPNFSFSNPSGNNNNGIGYGIGPFVRYYFLDSENRVNILSHLAYGYGRSKNDNGYRANANTYIFKAGPAIFLNNNVALELTLDYETWRSKDNSGDKTGSDTFGISAGFQIHLGKK